LLHGEERGPFVGTSAAEEDDEDITDGERHCSLFCLCNPPVNKHLARVRFGRCLLPAIGSGRAPLLDLIVTRSDKVVAQGNRPVCIMRPAVRLVQNEK